MVSTPLCCLELQKTEFCQPYRYLSSTFTCLGRYGTNPIETLSLVSLAHCTAVHLKRRPSSQAPRICGRTKRTESIQTTSLCLTPACFNATLTPFEDRVSHSIASTLTETTVFIQCLAAGFPNQALHRLPISSPNLGTLLSFLPDTLPPSYRLTRDSSASHPLNLFLTTLQSLFFPPSHHLLLNLQPLLLSLQPCFFLPSNRASSYPLTLFFLPSCPLLTTLQSSFFLPSHPGIL